jgi:hypothetical protein
MKPLFQPITGPSVCNEMNRCAVRFRALFLRIGGALLCAGVCAFAADDLPDISSVPPDLVVPEVTQGAPKAGHRVPGTATGWDATRIHHLLYLPTDWSPSETFPVLVEWTGNQYKSPSGDTCSGEPEGGKLGFGITGGRGAVWLTLPYLDDAGKQMVATWWGNAPAHDPKPTLAYCRAAVDEVCARFRGDPNRVVLAGFSRGSIATNYLGLHDDETARLWRGFVCYSHYDGVVRWRYPGSDVESAVSRLRRLGGRPQFVCGENANAAQTQSFLEKNDLLAFGAFTFCSTGFRNHDDAWILRPSQARDRLRAWFWETLR